MMSFTSSVVFLWKFRRCLLKQKWVKELKPQIHIKCSLTGGEESVCCTRDRFEPYPSLRYMEFQSLDTSQYQDHLDAWPLSVAEMEAISLVKQNQIKELP